MRRAYPVLILLAAVAGCGEGFPDEEMHFGRENKVRPFLVIVNPPDAAPGDLVTVTLQAQAPDPDEVDIVWRAALDFDRGLYGADEVERRQVDITAPLPTADADGFMRQSFAWTIPDSVHLWTSAIPEVLTDPVVVALAEQLIGPAVGSPPRKEAVDAWLRDLRRYEVDLMDPAEREAVWALADRFACQVRFRATLQAGITVDATRNLTVRHTRRLGGPNTNLNTFIPDFAVVALEKKDAGRGDLHAPDVAQTWYRFRTGGAFNTDFVQVPVHDDWTYYAVTSFAAQTYTSPYGYEGPLAEVATYRWYYYRQDAPGSGHQFFVTDEGNEAEMWQLDRESRLRPAGAGSRFRMVTVARDERPEWEAYHAVPGAGAAEGTVEFVTP